jgi:hypothetical protein
LYKRRYEKPIQASAPPQVQNSKFTALCSAADHPWASIKVCPWTIVPSAIADVLSPVVSVAVAVVAGVLLQLLLMLLLNLEVHTSKAAGS